MKVFNPDELVRSCEQTEEIKIETADISNKFKFFETYQPKKIDKKPFRITPPREGVVKVVEDAFVLMSWFLNNLLLIKLNLTINSMLYNYDCCCKRDSMYSFCLCIFNY